MENAWRVEYVEGSILFYQGETERFRWYDNKSLQLTDEHVALAGAAFEAGRSASISVPQSTAKYWLQRLEEVLTDAGGLLDDMEEVLILPKEKPDA